MRRGGRFSALLTGHSPKDERKAYRAPRAVQTTPSVEYEFTIPNRQSTFFGFVYRSRAVVGLNTAKCAEKGTSTVVKRNARAVYVRMDAAALKDLRSDAQHYATSMADGGFDDRGLIASAHATVKALAKGARKAAKA